MIGVDINIFCYLFINFTWQPNFRTTVVLPTCQLHFAFYHDVVYISLAAHSNYLARMD